MISPNKHQYSLVYINKLYAFIFFCTDYFFPYSFYCIMFYTYIIRYLDLLWLNCATCWQTNLTNSSSNNRAQRGSFHTSVLVISYHVMTVAQFYAKTTKAVVHVHVNIFKKETTHCAKCLTRADHEVQWDVFQRFYVVDYILFFLAWKIRTLQFSQMFIFGLKILVEDAPAEINSSSQDFLQFGVGP